MLKIIYDTFNICSSNQKEIKQEVKINIPSQFKERSQSPMIITDSNNIKLSKINDIKVKKQNLNSTNPSTISINNPNFSPILSYLSNNKTKESDEIEFALLFSKKNSYSNDEIENNYKLAISDFEGDLLNGKILIINAAGYKKSLRKKQDGITFFGMKTLNEKNKNDFILNLQKIIINNKNQIIETIFAIYFEKKEKVYYFQSFMKECDEKISYKIPNKISYEIKNKDHFLIGNYIFSVELGENDDYIRIIVIHSQNENNSINYIFKRPLKNQYILIGRSSKCNIHINSNLLSKMHCNISYDYDKKTYTIKDGFNNKYSTNGTWLVVNDKIKIINNNYDEFIKIGKKILKIEKRI